MDTSKKTKKRVSANERYLQTIYATVKRRESFCFAGKNSHFSDTELRLLAEIISAHSEGERLISTQLATRLNVTRSAVSQIVNRLEKEDVVKRTTDEVNKKIAYIELTEQTRTLYEQDWKNCLQFIGKVVKKFGEDRFNEMCALSNEFVDLLDAERNASETKKK